MVKEYTPTPLIENCQNSKYLILWFENLHLHRNERWVTLNWWFTFLAQTEKRLNFQLWCFPTSWYKPSRLFLILYPKKKILRMTFFYRWWDIIMNTATHIMTKHNVIKTYIIIRLTTKRIPISSSKGELLDFNILKCKLLSHW